MAGIRERLSAAAVTFTFVCFTGLLQLITNGTPPNDYTLFTWKWDYSLGFIRRGLLGWALHPLGSGPAFVLRVSVVVFVVCLLLYALYASIVTYMRPSLGTLAVAMSGVVLAPALPSFASTLGRLDQANFAILMTCCLLVTLSDGLAVAVVISLLGSAGVLVHEGFAIVHLPLVCSLFLSGALSRKGRFPAAQLATLLAGPLGTLALLLAFARPHTDLLSWASYWNAKDPFVQLSVPEYERVNTIHFGTLADNVSLVTQFAQAHRFSFLCGLLLAAALVPAAFILCKYAMTGLFRPRIWWLTFVSSFSPLMMFALGIDFIRWSSYIVINLVAFMLALIFLEEPIAFRASMIEGKHARYFAAALVLIFLCFPMSTGEEWPNFGRYNGCMYAAALDHRLIKKYCNGPSNNSVIFE